MRTKYITSLILGCALWGITYINIESPYAVIVQFLGIIFIMVAIIGLLWPRERGE